MKIRNWVLTIALACCIQSFWVAQAWSQNSRTKEVAVADSRLLLTADSTVEEADLFDELTWMYMIDSELGSKDAYPQLELAKLNSNIFDGSSLPATRVDAAMFFDDVDPNGKSGLLSCLSLIQSRNRFSGNWNTVGNIDLCPMLENSWNLLSPSIEQGIIDKLRAARAELGPIRLRGFYNIDVELRNASEAIKSVYVWGDKSTVHLFFRLNNNRIDCEADLTSTFGWPDREVSVLTAIEMEVVLQRTSNLSAPTLVSDFVVRFRDTQAWNDGTLYVDAFNQQVEDSFDATSEQIPLGLGNALFGGVNTTLTSFVTPRTSGLQFDYNSTTRQLLMQLNSNVVIFPGPIADQGGLSVSR